jgi:hypothetical protein
MPRTTTASRVTEKDRFHLALPEERMERARALANKRGTTLTETIRTSLGLLEAVEEEVREGNKIAVIDKNGKIVKQILLF